MDGDLIGQLVSRGDTFTLGIAFILRELLVHRRKNSDNSGEVQMEKLMTSVERMEDRVEEHQEQAEHHQREEHDRLNEIHWSLTKSIGPSLDKVINQMERSAKAQIELVSILKQERGSLR